MTPQQPIHFQSSTLPPKDHPINPKPNPLGLHIHEIAQLLAQINQPPYRAQQIAHWLYKKRIWNWDAMSDLPKNLRSFLHSSFNLSLPKLLFATASTDKTQKFLLQLTDGQLIETVLIPASPALYGSTSDRLTLCVSTQVGCAFACKFCASGLNGWKRNLSPEEIVAQILLIESSKNVNIDNIVFMGMGEPLANFQNLLKAIDILTAPWGRNIGARHITISTSGLVPFIRKLAHLPRQIRLAISLHGATDEVRSQIMPINRKYPLSELLDACAEYVRHKKQLLTFEYILISGLNDSHSDAVALAKIAKPLRAKINLIPYNFVQGLPWQRPTPDVQESFLRTLRSLHVKATLRREKGHSIAAACGQLSLLHPDHLQLNNAPNFLQTCNQNSLPEHP
ncbi:MAG: 23S rRNA (adenine(2503)-C(2))-methyltransferase RlmN [Chthoniobacterales bacterium]|nr:23S rRNA (adenine(2503)-C(2))-methyltransferase RlmN [Chthoniobacterales bacterium]MCX7712042.1 23S rRNA (adenine(2503)-C(2))-methyltransferase RlmN [Chthoniobacterales bacterium]